MDKCVPPTGVRERLISLVHEGQLGQTLTIKRLKEQFWWPKLDLHVKEWIEKCVACKNSEKRFRVGLGVSAHDQRIVEAVWDKICLDFIGPFWCRLEHERFAAVVVGVKSRCLEVVFGLIYSDHLSGIIAVGKVEGPGFARVKWVSRHTKPFEKEDVAAIIFLYGTTPPPHVGGRQLSQQGVQLDGAVTPLVAAVPRCAPLSRWWLQHCLEHILGQQQDLLDSLGTSPGRTPPAGRVPGHRGAACAIGGPASEREIERRRDRRPDCRGHRRRQQRSRVSDTARHSGLGGGTVQVRKLLRLRKQPSQGGQRIGTALISNVTYLGNGDRAGGSSRRSGPGMPARAA
ncbi:hypothetical protein NDU88_007047 [Pleurodeles waltl]|uniref:Integrase zinc-binding domain-containing protein n=1 Tax=Pleurodeles waltl TaxID=8319 RepID=A0AAV7ME19_PLEWA|nr:hypothetical protein NDU88_007047 [Pleurodeles waltl]